MSVGNVVTLDSDAAGWGWYTGLDGQVPRGLIDLVTVLVHELGHILGLEHTRSGVMDERLAPGETHQAAAISAHAPTRIGAGVREWIHAAHSPTRIRSGSRIHAAKRSPVRAAKRPQIRA